VDGEMSFDDIKAIFDQMRELIVVKITGGEPFLREDLPELLDYFINKRGLLVQLTSNGLLTDRIVKAVSQFANPRLHICISLDGVGKFVDEMRGIPGFYNTVLDTLRGLKKISERKRFFLAINQTIFAKELSQIGRLRFALSELGIGNIHYSVEHNLFDPKWSEDEKKNYWKNVPENTLLSVKNEVRQFPIKNRMRRAIYNYYFRGLENRVGKGLKKPNFKCTALSSYFRMYPTGDILTCSVITKPVGNLRNEDFMKVWRSSDLERARRVVNKCEGCWFGCEVVPNATVSGNIIKGALYR